MSLDESQIIQLQNKILLYYKANGRDLPWRKTTDPYKILISELMLQQTQVSRVIEYYNKWITTWPNNSLLAEAKRKDVLHAWMGLGYNTRGINLHKASQIIVEDYQGDVIKAMKNYKKIPGIGKYTSQAVQIFSINADIVTVDTNIRRIFMYEFNLPADISDSEIWNIAQRCLPKGKSREWHNALMDYGAMYLTSKKTGIPPKTIQSKFEGSDRQIRAQILRQLLNKPVAVKDLQQQYQYESDRLLKILEKMKKQGIIKKEKNYYVLNES
ncbi:MAG: Fe-S cluster assembly protein HesB [Thermoplasmatota archaeon]